MAGRLWVTGGTPPTGGMPATGGSKVTGGAPAPGGSKATGGTAGAGTLPAFDSVQDIASGNHFAAIPIAGSDLRNVHRLAFRPIL